MKACFGISQRDYCLDIDGERVGHSPLFHHPDRCPFYAGREYGNCELMCGGVETFQRSCNKVVTGPAIPPRSFFERQPGGTRG